MARPAGWTEAGLPCYASGFAPSFLWPEGQFRERGLRPAGDVCAFVDSKYGPAALYLITETELADPRWWSPSRPDVDGASASKPSSAFG